MAAAVPDLSSPAIIPFALAAGGLVGAAVGRARGLERERVREIAENWAFAAGLLAAVAYLVALAAGV